MSPCTDQTTTYYHYIVVRADLTNGQKFAQIAHAAGESAANRDVPEGTHAIILEAKDEEELLDIADFLWYGGIKDYSLIIEPDLPTDENSPLADGQGTAIGIPPTESRRAIRKVLGRLKLLK